MSAPSAKLAPEAPAFPQLYFCCDERRRDAVRGSATLNGMDHVEVVDHDAATEPDRQRFLRVHFVNPLAPGALTADNVRITGGERIRPVVIRGATIGTGDDANVLTVEVAQPGDFSIYTLSLVRGPHDPAPPEKFDPRLAWVEFSFKVECPADFDCAPRRACPPEPRPEPEINYLAKDYASFRKLLLDRMSLLLPAWRERNPADLGVTLVELLAYVGDQLSYQQDAVATEAYLDTARKRVSLRRHARLVDYQVHDGTNARVWVQLATADDNVLVPAGRPIFSRLERIPPLVPPASQTLDEALRQRPAVFETRHDATLFAAHHALPFYTWGDRECCLPKGATRATLAGHFPHLAAGAVLIFEEVRAPRTGAEEDADRTRRHALRLAAVQAFADDAHPLADPLTSAEITGIAWLPEDALPFPFCLSGFTDEKHGAQFRDDFSIARGNIVLADHGQTVADEPLGTVPEPRVLLPPDPGVDRCDRPAPRFSRPRFVPALAHRPLTHAAPYDPVVPASVSLRVAPADARPAIRLESRLGADAATWEPRRDLLGSAPDAAEFVVETESDGTAQLRFGDDAHGRAPEAGTAFTATYRVGNGSAGNLGAETLAHLVSDDPAITGVRNPLPAAGGTDPETAEEIRRDAPEAFRTQQRAVTEADYARFAERGDRRVQRAAATLRWTGSWHTVFITVDRFDGRPLTEAFETDIRRQLEPFRLAGHDLEIDTPRYVPLELAMFVCVQPGYFRSDVRTALLALFSNGTLADGRRGLFHPDAFTFGQTVHLSPFVAAAQATAGVASVEVTTFQRQGLPETSGLANGSLALNRLEIARLDNDPNFAERGRFTLNLGGGR